jgi:hypothetical protein
MNATTGVGQVSNRIERWVAIDTRSSTIRGESGMVLGGYLHTTREACIVWILKKYPHVVASGVGDPNKWSIRPMMVIDPGDDLARPSEMVRRIIELTSEYQTKVRTEGISYDESADVARLFHKDIEAVVREYTRPDVKLAQGD